MTLYHRLLMKLSLCAIRVRRLSTIIITTIMKSTKMRDHLERTYFGNKSDLEYLTMLMCLKPECIFNHLLVLIVD